MKKWDVVPLIIFDTQLYTVTVLWLEEGLGDISLYTLIRVKKQELDLIKTLYKQERLLMSFAESFVKGHIKAFPTFLTPEESLPPC